MIRHGHSLIASSASMTPVKEERVGASPGERVFWLRVTTSRVDVGSEWVDLDPRACICVSRLRQRQRGSSCVSSSSSSRTCKNVGVPALLFCWMCGVFSVRGGSHGHHVHSTSSDGFGETCKVDACAWSVRGVRWKEGGRVALGRPKRHYFKNLARGESKSSISRHFLSLDEVGPRVTTSVTHTSPAVARRPASRYDVCRLR